MKGRSLLWRVGLVLLLCCAPVTAHAEEISAARPQLLIREAKITGDEFVVLQATDHIPELSEYWIGYVGSDTAEPGTIVPVQQLPHYELQAGQAVLLTSDGAEVCDAVLTTKLTASLGDSKGTLVVRQLQNSGITSTFTTIDSVNWAKPSASSETQAQLDIRKEAGMTYAVWYHDPTYVQPWRVGNLAACTLTLGLESTRAVDPPATIEWTQAAIEPPAIIEASATDESTTTAQSSANQNLGLAPPLITELLPNPMGTGTDATDEFIELYNSNDAVFTLSGFTLQTGLSTTHSWLIPTGVTIPAKGYKVLYATDSKLSMSNTSGQVTLFDTAGTKVAQSDPYDSAPDGQAWALANGAWYWTTKPTPGGTNDIAAPIVKAATASKKVTTTATAVKGTTTKTPTKATTVASKTTASGAQNQATSVALHPLVLASVALAAIGYGVYEYRHDLANAFSKFRRNGSSRR